MVHKHADCQCRHSCNRISSPRQTGLTHSPTIQADNWEWFCCSLILHSFLHLLIPSINKKVPTPQQLNMTSNAQTLFLLKLKPVVSNYIGPIGESPLFVTTHSDDHPLPLLLVANLEEGQETWADGRLKLAHWDALRFSSKCGNAMLIAGYVISSSVWFTMLTGYNYRKGYQTKLKNEEVNATVMDSCAVFLPSPKKQQFLVTNK